MPVEIERRFLVANAEWKSSAEASSQIRQAYLAATVEASVRVRIKDSVSAFLTIKSAKAEIERAEFEYAIPIADAEHLITLRLGKLIEKQRFILTAGSTRWEIDVFEGELQGLVIAEIELDDKDRPIDRPLWLGREVTTDIRYSNASLAMKGLPKLTEP